MMSDQNTVLTINKKGCFKNDDHPSLDFLVTSKFLYGNPLHADSHKLKDT